MLRPADADEIDWLERRLGGAVRRTEEAYEAGEHEMAELWDEESARREQELEGFLVEVEESELEEPRSQQAPLQHVLADLYAEHLQGFPMRSGATLEEMGRDALWDYSAEAARTATDEQIVEAAGDAYEAVHERRLRVRSPRHRRHGPGF